jgi:hypothetical protein
MNHRIFLLVSLVASLVSAAFGQFTGSESFSGALGGNWSASFTDNVNGFASKSLAPAGGQLEWLATTNATAGGNGGTGVLTWTVNQGSYTSDWSASLKVYNNWDRVGANGTVDIGLQLWNTTDTADYVKVVLKQATAAGTVVHTGLHSNTAVTAAPLQNNPLNSPSTSSGPYSVGMSFSSSNKVITTYYNFGSGWTLLGSFGVGGSGGTVANADWGTSGPSAFTIGILADAMTFDANAITLNSGTVYADDFSLSATPITAVPEPSTYAAFAGLAALGLAFWRRRLVAR